MDLLDFIFGGILGCGAIAWAAFQPCPLWVAVVAAVIVALIYVEVRK